MSIIYIIFACVCVQQHVAPRGCSEARKNRSYKLQDGEGRKGQMHCGTHVWCAVGSRRRCFKIPAAPQTAERACARGWQRENIVCTVSI